MAKIHFFTDVNDLDSQTIAGSAFGVVPNQPLKFNVVDWFTSQSTDIMAYAVCGGEVFIESIAGSSTLINLILKPSQQPPFNFPKVKFFIYRGILKSSLIDNGIIKENAGDLSETLWKAQQALNVALNINDEPSEELLGINNHFFETDQIFQNSPIAKNLNKVIGQKAVPADPGVFYVPVTIRSKYREAHRAVIKSFESNVKY